MNLSDFLIRGRHLFGFLVPGVMWVSVAFLLLLTNTPLSFVENSDNPLMRSLLILAIGYVSGFCLQTILFPLITNPLKARIVLHPSLHKLPDLVEKLVHARLPRTDIEGAVARDRLPLLCKFYVLEHSQELRKLVLEKEADINLLVANMVPGPLLLVTWTWRNYSVQTTVWVVSLVIVVVLLLLWRLRRYLAREVEEWYETFLVLQLTNYDVESSASKEQL